MAITVSLQRKLLSIQTRPTVDPQGLHLYTINKVCIRLKHSIKAVRGPPIQANSPAFTFKPPILFHGDGVTHEVSHSMQFPNRLPDNASVQP